MKALNETFTALKLAKHPDKTFIGRIDKGFDFLVYHFSRKALTLANHTIQHFRAHLRRLYEQQQTAPDRGAAVLGDYVTRWRRWAAAGLGELQSAVVLPPLISSPFAEVIAPT